MIRKLMNMSEKLERFYRVVDRQICIMERIAHDEYEELSKIVGEEANKWHDLRKDPTDLPKDTKTVWVILSERPTEVEMDSYNPEDKGNVMTIPAYDRETEDGHTEHIESRKYIASGWWAYDEPGWVTHWMYMNVPEPPKE